MAKLLARQQRVLGYLKPEEGDAARLLTANALSVLCTLCTIHTTSELLIELSIPPQSCKWQREKLKVVDPVLHVLQTVTLTVTHITNSWHTHTHTVTHTHCRQSHSQTMNNNNKNNYCIDHDGHIYLNLSKSIQSATGLKALKPAANGRCVNH